MNFFVFSRNFKNAGHLILWACATRLFAFAETPPASAKSVMWQGGTSSDWNTGSN